MNITYIKNNILIGENIVFKRVKVFKDRKVYKNFYGVRYAFVESEKLEYIDLENKKIDITIDKIKGRESIQILKIEKNKLTIQYLDNWNIKRKRTLTFKEKI